MARIKAESGEKVYRLEEKVAALEKENAQLKKCNRLLTDKNARLKSIPGNDSSNTFLPPSTAQKPAAKRENEYNGRTAAKRESRCPGEAQGKDCDGRRGKGEDKDGQAPPCGKGDRQRDLREAGGSEICHERMVWDWRKGTGNA